MSSPIAFGGLASGLDWRSLVDQLYAVGQQSTVQPLQQRKSAYDSQVSDLGALISKTSALQTAVKNLRTATGATLAAKSGTVSDSTKLTANVQSTALSASYSIGIVRLATKTSVSSASTVSNAITGATSISSVNPTNGEITTGNFTVVFGSNARQVAVNTGDTVQDVLNRISTQASAEGITLNTSIDVDGKITLTNTTDGRTIKLGVANDTSNFASKTFLDTQPAAASVTSARIIKTLDLNQPASSVLSGLGTTVTDGTFTINNVSFDTTGKTLAQILSEVNASTAKVNLTYDGLNDKFNLSSTVDGNSPIALTAGTSNFLTATGLAGTAQNLGQTAQITVNGGPVQDFNSNSGVTIASGVNVDLKGGAGSTVSLTVDTSSDTAVAAVQKFATAYNDVVRFIKDKTSQTGSLKGFSGVKSLLNSLTGGLQEIDNTSTTYKTLGSIGISTGAISGTLGTVTREITVDTGTFTSAYKADPGNIENLLNNVLNGVQTTLTGAVQATTGTLVVAKDSTQTRSSSTQEAIDRAIKRLDRQREIQLQQFQGMEKLIAQYKGQNNQFTQASSG